jgi:hypothetical protein
MILLTIIAGLLGACIGNAPTIAPGTGWVSYLWVAAALTLIVTILEVCDRRIAALPSAESGSPVAAESDQHRVSTALISGEIKVKFKPNARVTA